MSNPARARMTSDEFIAWAMEQPETERYELVAGEIFAMAPERATHVRTKYRVARLLDDAIVRAGLRCEMLIDGMSVQVDADTNYVPDVLVRCGVPVAGDTLSVADPLILVEVLSPSTVGVDTGMKLADYFRIPSVRHYLIVRAETRTVIHHARDAAGVITTRIVRDGTLMLDPPGIELRDLFV
jgi:Uma2 family endonuclease